MIWTDRKGEFSRSKVLSPFMENGTFAMFEGSRIRQQNTPLILTTVRVLCLLNQLYSVLPQHLPFQTVSSGT